MSDDSSPAAQAPVTDDAAKKAKRNDRRAEISGKAKEAATKSGKDWETMSKEDKQTFRKAARTEMRADATKRRATRAKRKAAGVGTTSEA